MPHSSHEVAVHTKGTIVGTLGFYLGNSLSSNGGLTRWSCRNRVPSPMV